MTINAARSVYLCEKHVQATSQKGKPAMALQKGKS